MRVSLLRSFLSIMILSTLACRDAEPERTAGSGGGGGAGNSGFSGMGGSGGATIATPVPCGSTSCFPPPNPLAGLAGGIMLPIALPTPVACCFAPSSNQCGVSISGGVCEAVAVPDTRCPGIDLTAVGGLAAGLPLGNVMTGCCTAAGMCGLDGGLFGRGCVENAEAKAMLGALPLIGTLLPIPAAVSCNQALDADAGEQDAGL